MKRLIAIFGLIAAIATVLAMAIPVGAYTTSVSIGSGTGGGDTAPVVKCKWEQDTSVWLEDGDKTHVLYPNTDPAYSQFNPPMSYNTTKTINYFAVVTDAEDMGAVANVFALVFHPVNSPAPYGTYTGTVPDPGADPTLAARFKYKIEFTDLGHSAAQITQVLTANNDHLVDFNAGFDISEIAGLATSEMNKGTADLWMGTAEIDYEQPGGYYTVRDYAIDTNNAYSTALENQFLYVPTPGVEVDFTAFNYGPINLHAHVIRAGDLTWNNRTTDGTPVAGTAGYNSYGATVRNIGNVWTKITVQQNDMAFGNHAGSNPVTTYQGLTAPTAALSNWNVYYDLRLGSTGAEGFYDPNVAYTTPEFLGLSTLEELDFSINVNQGSLTHTGTMTISATSVPFNTTSGSPIGTPDD
jgi:hypothetical protein